MISRISDSGRIPVGGHWETLSRGTATLCGSAGLDAGCRVSMLQRPIVKAKNCVPTAPRTIGEGVASGIVSHCGFVLTEHMQTLRALAYMKMEVAGDDLGHAHGRKVQLSLTSPQPNYSICTYQPTNISTHTELDQAQQDLIVCLKISLGSRHSYTTTAVGHTARSKINST